MCCDDHTAEPLADLSQGTQDNTIEFVEGFFCHQHLIESSVALYHSVLLRKEAESAKLHMNLQLVGKQEACIVDILASGLLVPSAI